MEKVILVKNSQNKKGESCLIATFFLYLGILINKLKIKVMKREKRVYENGYWGKISYWSTLLETAVREQNTKGAVLCGEKLSYFTNKQKELVK